MTAIKAKNSFPYDVYIIMLLRSEVMKKEIDLKTDPGTILNSLNVRNIPLLRFVEPDLGVLESFENLIKPLWKLIDNNFEEIIKLGSIRDTLLPKLMSGEIEA